MSRCNSRTGYLSGPERHLPTVTVGIGEGMFQGRDHLAIQGAVDYVTRLGGGTVCLLPGRYTLRNAVFLSSRVTLRGAGDKTVLEKGPSVETQLASDQDWYEWQLTVRDAGGFAVGDGLFISSEGGDRNDGIQPSLHTIVGISNNVLFLDSQPRVNHWLVQNPRARSLHSLIEARFASDIIIEDLAIEGCSDENARLNGNDGAAIFFYDCENMAVRNVSIDRFNGDAISWQVAHNVRVENCEIRKVTGIGLHPGSGSRQPVMRGNAITSCDIGIYWCWGVRHGIAENNSISDCEADGISIGHRDCDNVIRGNQIRRCKHAAIDFRPEDTHDRSAHRVTVEQNVIECPAHPPGAQSISLAPHGDDIVLRNNTITPGQKNARPA